MSKRLKSIAIGRLLDICDVYVFDGGVRALSKRGFVALLSGKAGKNGGDKDGQIDERIAALPSRYAHLAVGTNIEFSLPGGGVGHAIDAKRVIEICRAYSEADDAGELRANQRHLARNARRLINAAAEVGLTHLIDEASGYDAIRQRGELSRLFGEEMRPWEETFSPTLTARLCALGCAGEKNARWNGGSYPQPLASTFRRIYDLILGESAARAMKERNPEPAHGSNHHQLLTAEAHELLKRNMGIVSFAAQQSHSRGEFFSRLGAHYNGQTSLVYAN